MFWGMNLKPNRKYTQTTGKNFHISQAALDCESLSEEATSKIYINSEDNQKFLVCTLRKGSCEQTPLDLNFAEGDTICFQSIGTGNVSLTGYLTPNNYLFDDDDDDDEDDEEEDEENVVDNEDDAQNGNESKNKKKQKKPKASDDDDEDDDEEENELLKAALESDDEDDEDGDDDGGDDDDDDDEDEDDDDEAEDDEEDEIQEPKRKMVKLDKKEAAVKKQQQQQQQQQNGVQNAQKSKKEKKAEKQQQKQQQQQQKNNTGGGERTLSGGVKVEDVRVGNGPEVKPGKRAQVYYEGRLKSNNKVFDSLKNGPPFKFNVGRGDVIKGWDVGVVGMKVGGRRRITCPPHMAYGARGSPPAIPPNSTLVFEVELKGVN